MSKDKLLLKCPRCEREGIKEILAEVNPTEDDEVKVMRFKNGYTLVRGSMFAIICGRCNEVIYTHHEL